ncbi:MAG: DegT/DnrJ/EryC1/StrS family aminotransferase [Armatimonadetes bacterium]|nr:DegT/DnrJ/EryC1/StrS family aminotransferase [Armatimonadota bacterium]
MSSEKLAVEGGTPVRKAPLPTVGNKSGRDFGQEEIANLTEVINSGRLFRYGGKFVIQLENEFAEMLGMKHGIASTSGTSALHIAIGAIYPDPGDEIITSPITDMGTLIGILAQNAIPVFADLDPKTYTMMPESIEACITGKTKAIIPVHLFGQMADMDPILAIAKKHGLKVIEDCCQAYFAEYKGHISGTMGDLGCFSMQQSKHMTTGDGGITVTNDDDLARRAKLFADKGWPREPGARDYLFLGMNYRMNELTGAVACAQMKKVKGIVERRRKAADAITAGISKTPGVNPPVVREGCKHSWWLYPITIDQSVLRCTSQEFAKALSAEGISAGVGYIGKPIFMTSIFQEQKVYGRGCPFTCEYATKREYKESDTPNTVKILENIITLQCNEFFTDKEVSDFITAINKVARHYARS